MNEPLLPGYLGTETGNIVYAVAVVQTLDSRVTKLETRSIKSTRKPVKARPWRLKRRLISLISKENYETVMMPKVDKQINMYGVSCILVLVHNRRLVTKSLRTCHCLLDIAIFCLLDIVKFCLLEIAIFCMLDIVKFWCTVADQNS